MIGLFAFAGTSVQLLRFELLHRPAQSIRFDRSLGVSSAKPLTVTTAVAPMRKGFFGLRWSRVIRTGNLCASR
ncbi:MAG TPA: hypothetical protein DCG06_00590, partial [Deltaproteobacteria bacterium]|nr:hypothetical protein [Deltaproteobacteria bacterium]